MLKSTITTCAGIISLPTWDDAHCEAVLYSCKKDSGNACIAKACADYTKTDGTSTGLTTVSTDAHCHTLDSTCIYDSSNCKTAEALCSTYTTAPTCTYSLAGECKWNGETCGLKTAFSSCSDIVLTTAGWTTANCEAVLKSCKKDTGDACISKVCADYTT